MGLEYIYAALLLHEVKKPVDEEGLAKVLEAAGAEPDPARIKALVESLAEVNIDEVLKTAAAAPVAVAAPAAEEKAPEEKPAEKKEEKKEEEAALAGLSALFG